MRSAALAFAGALTLAAAPLAATSFVMVPDDALVDRAPVAVAASVLSVDAAPVAGSPATDYLIEVERVLKGDVPGSHLVVRVPGGMGPSGVGLKVWGAPAFLAGERVVLFLRPGDDGAFRVSQLMLGAFHEVEAGGEKLLVRDLAEVDEVPMPGAAEAGSAEYRLPRRREAFVEWIGERARGVGKAADYFYRAPPGAAPPRAITERFTAFCDNPNTPGNEPVGADGECQAGSFPLRWFDFGNGITAPWRLHEDGQPGLTETRTINALSQALAVWTDDAGSGIRYGLDSPVTTESTDGLADHDDLNVLLFDDPDNFIGEPFDCASGGILAIGGPWYTNDLGSFDGKQYLTILNGDIVTNSNLACFFQSSPDPQRLAAQLFAHELGHTLGFGHSCETFLACASDPDADAAIMRAFIHDTAHGPELRTDDVAAARHHYGTIAGNPPAAPSGLVATPVSPTTVLLDWRDESGDETGFVIEASSPVEAFHEVGTVGANVTVFAIGGLTTGRPYTFRVRAASGAQLSAPSNEASATPQADATAPCTADADTLCLLAERFRVEVQWRDQINGGNGIGLVQASPVGGSKTGVFSFFNPNNIELIVKALDGNPVNGHYWLFYGALSTVEYWVTVTDTATGDSNTYHNPPGELCGVPDTAAFPALSAPAAAPRLVTGPLFALPAAGASGTCVPSPTALCLADGRFEVTVDWLDQRTLDDGIGVAVPGSERTGYFWFFNAENVELVVKILDATAISGKWWVFYGALSDVQYTISVRDTITGSAHAYQNAPGNFCGQADTGRFPDAG